MAAEGRNRGVRGVRGLSSPSSRQSEVRRGDAKPFLKWAGGKQRLLSQYEAFFPEKFARYLEPFVGGGAVYFHLWNLGRIGGETMFLDSNEELINTYRTVRDELEELLALLARHKERHGRDYYYEIRNLDRQGVPLSRVERAARTIYLNKTCYNGLYRVNRRGQFNVPMGRYRNPRILDEERLRAAHDALQDVRMEVRDFRTVVDLAETGDLIYFDPPYDPLSRTANFTSYTAGSFQDEDQRDLADVFACLAEKRCLCMLSNSDTEFVHELYAGFRIEIVQATRAISRDARGRGAVNEVVVLNY